MTSIPMPFAQESELYKPYTSSDSKPPSSLPGHPRVSLQDAERLRKNCCRTLKYGAVCSVHANEANEVSQRRAGNRYFAFDGGNPRAMVNCRT